MNTIETIKSCSKCGELPKLIDTHIQLGTTPFIIIGESPAKKMVGFYLNVRFTTHKANYKRVEEFWKNS